MFRDFFIKTPKWLVIVILILVTIRLAMPPVGKWIINRSLANKMGEYTGSIDDFDLSLYRGAYQILGLQIKKKNSNLQPLIQVREIDISVAWRSLLHKVVTTDITMLDPVIHFADSKDKADKQSGLDEPPSNWQSVADTIFPVKIESFFIHNGAIDFTKTDLKKPLPVKLEKVEFYVEDLRTQSKGTYSPFKVKALLQEHADIFAEGKVDILSMPMKGDIDFQMTDFKLNTINQLLLAYIPLDVTKGTFSMYGETVYSGDAKGYVKVFFRDGDIIFKKQDIHGVKHFFLEIIGAFGNWVLQNNKTKSIAAEIPFQYTKGKLDVNASKAFWSAVKNKGEHLSRGIDNKVSLKKSDEKQPESKERP